MVCHATYKNVNGDWVFPNDVDERNGKLYQISNGLDVNMGRAVNVKTKKM